MAITGNKGEWSEIYALLKLLGDGKVYAGTPDLKRGFSIKSKLGSPSTLLNSSEATNIVYQINGELSDEEIKEINNIDRQSDRLRLIEEYGCPITYFNYASKTFFGNLLLIDGMLPEIVADCLLEYYKGTSISATKDVVKILSSKKENSIPFEDLNLFYSFKIKKLLLDAALGMMPSTKWNGRYEANGGYLVVKADGDIVCYHFYNKNDVESYLYNNTKFDTPSRTRHKFGEVYRDTNGALYMKLNLQIRFQ